MHIGTGHHVSPSSDGHSTPFSGHSHAIAPVSRAKRHHLPIYESRLKRLGKVSFPEWTGERVYMVPFRPAYGLPAKLARWQPTVDQMLQGIDAPGDVYLMVDQSVVKAGEPQRRPGVHIDGNWVPGDSHGAVGGYPETLLLASDVEGCIGYAGHFSGRPGEGGDCSHIDLSGLKRTALKPGYVYAGNVTFLHESVAVKEDCQRTLVRLNVPNHSF